VDELACLPLALRVIQSHRRHRKRRLRSGIALSAAKWVRSGTDRKSARAIAAGKNLAPDPSAPIDRAVFLPRCAAPLLVEQRRGGGGGRRRSFPRFRKGPRPGPGGERSLSRAVPWPRLNVNGQACVSTRVVARERGSPESPASARFD
jgi:hypothetical protein